MSWQKTGLDVPAGSGGGMQVVRCVYALMNTQAEIVNAQVLFP